MSEGLKNDVEMGISEPDDSITDRFLDLVADKIYIDMPDEKAMSDLKDALISNNIIYGCRDTYVYAEYTLDDNREAIVVLSYVNERYEAIVALSKLYCQVPKKYSARIAKRIQHYLSYYKNSIYSDPVVSNYMYDKNVNMFMVLSPYIMLQHISEKITNLLEDLEELEPYLDMLCDAVEKDVTAKR